jgi:hypothetical protein
MSRCITYKCALAQTAHELDSPGCSATENLTREVYLENGVLLGRIRDLEKTIETINKSHEYAIDREFKALSRLDRALAWAWRYRKIARINPVNYYTQEEIEHAKEVGALQSKLFVLWEVHDKYQQLLKKVLHEVDERLGVEAGDPLVEEIRDALDKPQ